MLQAYEQHQRSKGNKPRSIDETMRRLRYWHDPEVPVATVSQAHLAARYRRRADQVAPDTHRNELAQTKTFWRWVVKQGLRRVSPAEGIEPVGRRRHGKAQLRQAECQRFAGVALGLADQGDQGAVAALAVLYLGIRASELLERQVRDVDVTDGGVVLWIPSGKTEHAARRLEVPDPVADLLALAAVDREPDEWLFPSTVSQSGHRGRTWLLKNVRRLCRLAGVPRVPPHGLRGTHSTLATDAGVSPRAVADSLGHGSESVTRRSYIEPGASDRARVRRFTVIAGGK